MLTFRTSSLGFAVTWFGLTAALGGCSSSASPTDAQGSDEVVAAADVFCPQGFAYDLDSQLCLSATEAAGPFPRSMIDFCRQFNADRADGTNVCEINDFGFTSTRWDRATAVNGRLRTRGADGCAQGTTFDAAQGYCSDGTNLYGPFSRDDVFYCQTAWGGGAACETNRIGAGMARPKTPPPAPSSFNVANEIAVNGATWGKLVIAVGYAEGTLSPTGGKNNAYFGHGDSGLRNIGLWSCTVCSDRSGPEADQYYYNQFIAPEVNHYLSAAGAYANHPMVAAAFFGLLVQSPDAALNDFDADDFSLVNLLARGQLSGQVTEDKLLDLLVRAWTVNGRMLWTNPDTNQFDGVRGRQDQLRRLQAYADSLRAQGVNPYP